MTLSEGSPTTCTALKACAAQVEKILFFTILESFIGNLYCTSNGRELTGIHFENNVKRIVGFCPEIVHTKFFDLKGNQWIRNNDALPFRKLEAFLLFYFKSQPNASPPSDSTLKFNINSSTNSDYCKFNKDQFNSTESRHLHGIPVLFDSKSSNFLKAVWSKIYLIPFGKTISYKGIASQLGAPNKSRACGLAAGRNPFPILVPCHRVIGSNKKLTGFGGGLEIKKHLLEHEGVHILNDTVINFGG